MFRTILLLCFFCGVVGALPAQSPASCSAPTLVRHHYLASAKILALRQMLGDPALADSVEIPATLYNPILEALSAVYNATQYPERDTVTTCLNILAFPAPVSPIAFTLSADTSELWAKKLYLDYYPTGDSIVDDLLVRYHLRKTSSILGDQYLFHFQVTQPVNTVALAALFDSVPNSFAEAEFSLGETFNITLDTVADGLQLTYEVGWGDCPAGCIAHRRWTFLVRPDCSVQFLGVEGNPLTAEVPCNAIFGCATEPLCLPWVQDSLAHYLQKYPGCVPSEPNIFLTLYEDFDTDPVLGIRVFIGIDAEFTDFFYCSGDYIGTCQITIGGPGCVPENLSVYQQGDTVWTCAQPLPTPANCGLVAAQEPRAAGLAFQLSPNPATAGQVLLKIGFTERSPARLTVLDVYGKVVFEKSIDTVQLEEMMDLSGQGPGLYFVRLEVGGQSGTRKLLLARE
ncbi:MAG: T9SS type A sorting domain-containing protein [Saprospiraceae bacterium]